MRVLHLAPGRSRPGGIATYASRFGASLRRAGVDVQPCDVQENGLGPLRNFDLVHAELGGSGRDEFWALARLATTRELPFVATLHDPPRCVWRPYEQPALARGRAPAAAAALLTAPRARRAERAVAGAAAALFVMSEAARPAVRRTLGPVAESRLRTIPHPRARPPREPVGSAGRAGPVIGFHGYWFGGKGLEVLVDAFAILRDDPRPVTARLWGEAPPGSSIAVAYRDRVMRRIRDRGVGHLVSVGGPIRPAALQDTLREADVIVLPHTSDALTYRGLKAVSGALEDALGAGVPVLASDVRGFAGQVRAGVDGLLVPPGDPQALAAALRTLRDDPQLLRQLQLGAATPRPAPEPGAVARALYEEVLA